MAKDKKKSNQGKYWLSRTNPGQTLSEYIFLPTKTLITINKEIKRPQGSKKVFLLVFSFDGIIKDCKSVIA